MLKHQKETNFLYLGTSNWVEAQPYESLENNNDNKVSSPLTKLPLKAVANSV